MVLAIDPVRDVFFLVSLGFNSAGWILMAIRATTGATRIRQVKSLQPQDADLTSYPFVGYSDRDLSFKKTKVSELKKQWQNDNHIMT
ncbi:hypothetical protein TWF569_000359 [Orbilia oligospora]|uniref:Uncharacterized protein n=1 Tax=Orbilia oligospora TaxID=2813651 RepID=A0A7C8J9Z8_ORBOL|nr:hypothetical protein TWF102_006814 [Orbilia oligospora]KAF3116268.1 hypothetical protein TWF706_003919 [Orbilia oligospora]KAF3133783.1 hypothetical protein TWF594_008942 [Orbilia oligospora]KAF3154383.1 hypothetical protein TWF569_000359 [Orbilia oligospora]KAF3178443.1 hypothetical protein TWF751_001466 [Orbilia oligospora]